MRRTTNHRVLSVIFALVCFSPAGWCDEPAPASASDQPVESSEPPAEEKKPEPTKINGVFEATEAEELSVETEQITALEIKRLVAHGTTVKKGQNVIVFETEDADKQIKDAAVELRLAKLTLTDDEFAYEQFLQTQELDRATAEHHRENAQQTYDNFVQVDRDREVLTAEFRLKSSEAQLENAMEELQQLEQMYKEDDLTEESEEIVLKRAKQAVEFAEFQFGNTKIASERSLSQAIPDSVTQQEDALARAELAYQKTLRDLASARSRQEIEINRKRDKFKDQEQKLAELKQERKQLVINSPIDGIVIHGKLEQGRMGDKASTLKAGSMVAVEQVVATIVNPKNLRIRVDLEEKDLSVVTEGANCTVTCKAFPDFETTATVKSVSLLPYAGNKYDCILTFKSQQDQPDILPTMTCELAFTPPAK
jgi:HlyD family secretion protein